MAASTADPSADGPDPQRQFTVEAETLQGAVIGDHASVIQTFVNKQSPAPKALFQIPMAPPDFTGRQDELRRLRKYFSDSAPHGPALCVITGMPGAGKTALALKFANELSTNYIDAQLYVNLHGYDPSLRLSATQVLDRFLRALGISGSSLPASLDEQVGLYRSLLAGKKCLIVLDNAATTAQIRDLLPRSFGCAVLVTSRHSLAGIVAQEGAHHLLLSGLMPKDSIHLFANIVGDQRVQDYPLLAEEVARLCAHLPLALRIAAAKLVVRPGMSFAHLVNRLRDHETRLEELASEDVAVRAAISFSYAELPSGVARLFRLLSLTPAQTFSAELVSALADESLPHTIKLLESVLDANLLEFIPSTDRYSIHDLVRLFATECLSQEESELNQHHAVSRMLHWLLQRASLAERSISPTRHRWWLEPESDPLAISPPPREEALQWFETERSSLLVACRQAVERGLHEAAWQLADASWSFFQLRKHWPDWRETHTLAVIAARAARNDHAEAWMLTALGGVEWETAQYDRAIRYLREALALHRHLADYRGQSRVLNNLGFTYYHLQRIDEAIRCSLETLDLARMTGDVFLEGWALYNLGKSHTKLGQFEEALTCCQSALSLFQQTMYRVGEGFALDSLGELHYGLEQFETAITYLQHALVIRRELQDRYGEAITLNHLGLALHRTGATEEGLQHRRLALDLLMQLNAPEATEIEASILEQGAAPEHPPKAAE